MKRKTSQGCNSEHRVLEGIIDWTYHNTTMKRKTVSTRL